jgi:transposase
MDDKYILDLLDLNCTDDIKIIKVETVDTTKHVYLEKKLQVHMCEYCGCRMHSKGIHHRIAHHPILQDGYDFVLHLEQRRWVCTNPLCKHTENDEFPFIEKHKRSTSLIPFMIINTMKDLTLSASAVARLYHTSDTNVHNIFTRYVDMKRLPLPEIISVDEVHFPINPKRPYLMVLMDFDSGQVIDILKDRYIDTCDAYFYSIPKEERLKVKYIISDMYDNYIHFPEKYFHNAETIIDGFHIISWLNDRISTYINSVKKEYQRKDEERLKKKNHDFNYSYKTIKPCKEVLLCDHYKWILLSKENHIKYTFERKWIDECKAYLDTYQLENEYMKLDSQFPIIKKLKDLFFEFDDYALSHPGEAVEKLNNLIKVYETSEQEIFIRFAHVLSKHFKFIIKSYQVVNGRRLSNGPMESFNRKPKDYKRLARGSSNFEYTRNRMLWGTRNNPAISGIPKSEDEIHKFKGKPRGKYKK